jgi:hypothetical protein
MLFACCVVSASSAQTGKTEQPNPKGEVLPLIEKFKAPSYPKSSIITKETYDYRIADKRTLPPTLTDTFICDIWQRITMDLKLSIKPEEVTEENVKKALDIYLTKDWNDIAGYRPWTHYNFIKGLKESQREKLTKEVVAYIKKNGVKDPEK